MWLDAAQTVSSIAPIISYICLASLLPNLCSRPLLSVTHTPRLFPANINSDGLYQCFVSPSVFPWLRLFSCFPLQCIQNLNFDPPTTCQTADLKPGAIHCLRVCVAWCVQSGAKASEFMSITVCVWSENNYLMGLGCLDLTHCVTNVS